MNRLIIIGAGGHGKVIADNAFKNGYSDICFVDDNLSGECVGFPIIGKTVDITKMNDGKTDFVIGIGKNEIRRLIAQTYDVNWVTIIHPSAQIAFDVSLGEGTVVMANASVNISASIGKHCIINTNSVVEHDNVIGDYVHISPNVSLGGTVNIGDSTHVGIGATISNNINVCNDCIIGAGAVIVKNISNSGTYVGIPVKRIK